MTDFVRRRRSENIFCNDHALSVHHVTAVHFLARASSVHVPKRE
jgi:hypothetical protein